MRYAGLTPQPPREGGDEASPRFASGRRRPIMAFQVPVIAWFVFKWIRKTPRLTLGVLGIQIVLALAAMAPVYILKL
jgi:hypothetical protein